MSVIGDLDDFESTARDGQAMRQLEETYILHANNAALTAKRQARTLSLRRQEAVHDRVPMEQSNLMCAVTQPPSPDTRIEVSTTWAEYEYAQDPYLAPLTHAFGFPRLWYDSTQKIATVVAAPTPLHSDMVGELMGHLLTACNNAMGRGGISETIRDCLTQSSDTANCIDGDDGLTIKEWDGALSYVADGERTLMVAFVVCVSQMYYSLRAAISWFVCALHCRLGIAMHISEGEHGERPKVQYYARKQEAMAGRPDRYLEMNFVFSLAYIPWDR
ncbi:hypothetical protein V1520DRAFT_371815 [Lipomyces starkeyi]|uniref:Uncharacterized protein n=1 Tax=Lipomyces starkeyi NRRL Y-11557 TaxID=675824 RepID=A0A1E3PV08_LIPST|nr:hypothetical protein LIPSTDRAFT_30924 [Lipomyces starkeyi NRRL Y-11557]